MESNSAFPILNQIWQRHIRFEGYFFLGQYLPYGVRTIGNVMALLTMLAMIQLDNIPEKRKTTDQFKVSTATYLVWFFFIHIVTLTHAGKAYFFSLLGNI